MWLTALNVPYVNNFLKLALLLILSKKRGAIAGQTTNIIGVRLLARLSTFSRYRNGQTSSLFVTNVSLQNVLEVLIYHIVKIGRIYSVFNPEMIKCVNRS